MRLNGIAGRRFGYFIKPDRSTDQRDRLVSLQPRIRPHKLLRGPFQVEHADGDPPGRWLEGNEVVRRRQAMPTGVGGPEVRKGYLVHFAGTKHLLKTE